jgi:hypothetical protein
MLTPGNVGDIKAAPAFSNAPVARGICSATNLS